MTLWCLLAAAAALQPSLLHSIHLLYRGSPQSAADPVLVKLPSASPAEPNTHHEPRQQRNTRPGTQTP